MEAEIKNQSFFPLIPQFLMYNLLIYCFFISGYTYTQTTTDTYERIKIGFNSSQLAHREILIGFFDEKATDSFDIGYDSVNTENRPDDMYFICNNQKLLIQGVGYFKIDAMYPIGITTTNPGLVNIILKELVNSPIDREVYVFDKLSNQYHDLKLKTFDFTLTKGVFEGRFYLCFFNKSNLKSDNYSFTNQDLVAYNLNTKMLDIQLNDLGQNFYKISLFNNLGQELKVLYSSYILNNTLHYPIYELSSGIYIVQILSHKGLFTYRFFVAP